MAPGAFPHLELPAGPGGYSTALSHVAAGAAAWSPEGLQGRQEGLGAVPTQQVSEKAGRRTQH